MYHLMDGNMIVCEVTLEIGKAVVNEHPALHLVRETHTELSIPLSSFSGDSLDTALEYVVLYYQAKARIDNSRKVISTVQAQLNAMQDAWDTKYGKLWK